MGKASAGGTWWRLLVSLIVMSGAVLAWVSARRRPGAELPPRTWSVDEPLTAPVPAAVDPVPIAAPAEPEPAAPAKAVATPDPATPDPATPDPATPDPATPEPAAPAAPAPAQLFDTPPASAPGPDASAPNGEPRPGPYPGSALPLPDGSTPSAEFVVKGNGGSMRSHSTSSPYFGRTRADVWFRTQEDAIAAGFRPWEPKK